MAKKRTNLWSSVEKIILEHYQELISERLRDGYYLVREYLNQDYLEKKKITMQEFEHFLSKQGYSTYRDDLWPDIEQKKGLDRPDAKPLGLIYNYGEELTVSQFEEVSIRARGFIFVEKAGEAEDIKVLSNHGWAVIAGQGYSTRLMRKLFKDDNRPVLVLHDADTSGDWIFKIFDVGSRRTKHLELWLDKVIDLGLNEEDAVRLDLPAQPEAKKYQKIKKMRYELSAFAVLKHRMKLENPVLAYTVAKMKKLGVRVTPTEVSLKSLLLGDVEIQIRVLLNNITVELEKITEKIPEFAWNVACKLNYPKGKAISASAGDRSDEWLFYESEIKLFDQLQKTVDEELEKIRPQLIIEAQKWINNPRITDVDAYEKKVIEETMAEKVLL